MCTAPAWAQQGGFSIQPGQNGSICAGSAVVEAWLSGTGGETAELANGGLPIDVQVFITRLRDARRSAPPAPPGGAP